MNHELSARFGTKFPVCNWKSKAKKTTRIWQAEPQVYLLRRQKQTEWNSHETIQELWEYSWGGLGCFKSKSQDPVVCQTHIRDHLENLEQILS